MSISVADVKIEGGDDATARDTYRVRKETGAIEPANFGESVDTGQQARFHLTNHAPARAITTDHRLVELSHPDGAANYQITDIAYTGNEVMLSARRV